MLFFFFKQKTAYEMRISDWSSDVCSSDLIAAIALPLNRDLGGIDQARVRQHRLRRYDVVEIGVAMLAVVEMIKGAARPAAAAIVDLEHDIAMVGEILLERAIADPAFVARTAVDVDHGGKRIALLRALGHIEDAGPRHPAYPPEQHNTARHETFRGQPGTPPVRGARPLTQNKDRQQHVPRRGTPRAPDPPPFRLVSDD